MNGQIDCKYFFKPWETVQDDFGENKTDQDTKQQTIELVCPLTGKIVLQDCFSRNWKKEKGANIGVDKGADMGAYKGAKLGAYV